MKKDQLFPHAGAGSSVRFLPLLILGAVILSAACSQQPVLPDDEGTVDVQSVGAVGDGVTDDTWAFQKAIDSMASRGGGTVYVPPGNYLIDADTSIKMRSNVYLDMVDSTRVLIAKPTESQRFNVIRMINISHARVIGGKIQGDRYTHLGTTGEWGMGICIYGSYNVRVINTRIVDCWGDGITVGARTAYGAPNGSVRVVIKNVVCRNNRRQGLTIGSVDSLIVDSCAFLYTSGTLPMDGIDIEPDNGTAQRVYITNCEIAHNGGNGVEMNAKPSTTAVIKDIHVQNNHIHHNAYSGYIQHVQNSVFNHNRLTDNRVRNLVYARDTVNCIFTPNTYQ
ncbi:glycoside hydrolase family 55 protein [Parapedobacter tibetensis]|uniref:glycoside hydrolase family 55 protein n=1 Tax=Parapedobacter tibetensis TaxID=2972951 RepID=UPI00214D57AD|nr:glycoside hydrolase family 55 protein [Parapedobacter tibetensis]